MITTVRIRILLFYSSSYIFKNFSRVSVFVTNTCIELRDDKEIWIVVWARRSCLPMIISYHILHLLYIHACADEYTRIYVARSSLKINFSNNNFKEPTSNSLLSKIINDHQLLIINTTNSASLFVRRKFRWQLTIFILTISVYEFDDYF